MPPKRESKTVNKSNVVNEESGITLDNILNPISNDTKETTKTKKITLALIHTFKLFTIYVLNPLHSK